MVFFEEALMRCEMCRRKRPEPMLCVDHREKEVEGKTVRIEVRHCNDIDLCIKMSNETLREAFK